jgi:hypothetical protein
MYITEIELKDNVAVTTGGTAHNHETLGEFMADLKPNEKQTLDQVNLALEQCGILPINEANYPEVKAIPHYHVMIHDLNQINEAFNEP